MAAPPLAEGSGLRHSAGGVRKGLPWVLQGHRVAPVQPQPVPAAAACVCPGSSQGGRLQPAAGARSCQHSSRPSRTTCCINQRIISFSWEMGLYSPLSFLVHHSRSCPNVLWSQLFYPLSFCTHPFASPERSSSKSPAAYLTWHIFPFPKG